MPDTDVFSPEKQRLILQGAACVFARDGYEGASMSRIAARAGVSKGTLYNYFAGKAELFSAWVAGECQAKLAHVFDAEQFFALCQTRVGMRVRLGLMAELDEALLSHVVECAVTMFLNTYGVKP